ncbi:MAG: proline dehydrogenase family protein, partial [Acidimicrobiales bacterium]|nr:proline dehydrogenase family protein [Acidimicrobiales bacterium]
MFDEEVTALARRIAELGSGRRAGVYRMSWWSERMLAWAMANPSFKTQLFRLVDVFPATAGDADVARHLHEYFAGADAPRLLDTGIDLSERIPFGERVSAQVARRNIARMARQFIVGTTPSEVVGTLARLWRGGIASTVDLLGERTVTASEADVYAARLDQLLRALVEGASGWAPDDHLERDDLGPLPRVSVSVKPTALAPRYAPLTSEEGKAEVVGRLRPLLALAAERGVLVWLDMEHYDTKDVTLELVRELLDDPALAGLYAGVVLQAYLKDCHADLSEFISFGADRLQTMPGAKPIHVRLVKGAYWDTETVQAEAEGWPAPVFADKGQTDANYERCTRLLHEHHGEVRSAFGSHNLRSLAYAVTDARHRGIPDSGYELQLLYGMAEPVSAALQRLGLRLRVYAPMGELVPGMSYLVRRLLENTANESFVRHRFAEGRSLDELVAPPPPVALPGPDPLAERPATDPEHPGPYRHQPRREWRRRSARSCFGDAVAELGQRLAQGPRLGQRLAQGPRLGQRLAQGNGIEVPALIGGEPVRTGATIVQVDPADPEVVVSTSASAGVAEADQAVASCLAAWERWSMTPARERAGVAFRAAEVLRRRRDELAALCVFEAGKPWADADGDVCEAIDFCEYYGREALRLERGGPVQSPPGETNVLRYQGKGVAAVIGPWNFPLAIPTGMTLAALMAGNAVVLKPAEQTPAIAAALVDVLLAAGLPPSVLAFLPGRGEVVGERLVAHPDVALVAFTGSRDVGLAINRAAAEVAPGQRHVKRVVAEMG